MTLIVQKFGGTSVGTLERIQHIANKIIQTRGQGHDVVVVVSAMSGETDRLIKLAKSIHADPAPREYAALLATGEQVSIALLSMALMAQGCLARSYTGAQLQIFTDNNYKKGRIGAIECKTLRNDLGLGYVPVIAGFQGVTEDGDITTLGRGGSDTTAVAIAAALEADECQIYTDVDGIYTADPRIVTKATRLDEIAFEEMFELASLGAKVVQQRAVEFAGQYQVPMRVLSSFTDGPGTLVSFAQKSQGQSHVTGIAFSRNEASFTLRGLVHKPEVVGDILATFAAEQIEIDMFQQVLGQNNLDIAFITPREDYSKVLAVLNAIKQGVKIDSIIGDAKIAKISLVGVGLRSHPAIMSTLFKCFSSHGVKTHFVSTSEIRVSVVVDETDMERCMQALHTAYGLDETGIREYQLT